MFIKVKKASDVLMNAALRKEFDSKVQARLMRKKKREEGDQGIRKMRDDLEARENAHKRQKISEEETKRRHQADVQQMRDDALRKREAQAQKRAARSTTESQTPIDVDAMDEDEPVLNDESIKIKWKPKKIQFTKEQIETIFRAYGSLSFVLLSPKKPGRATVAYQQLENAKTVMKEMFHHNPYGFRLEWAAGKEPVAVSPAATSAFASGSDKQASAQPIADLDAFEAEVMKKMQEAARKRKAAAAAAAASTAASPPATVV